jgi:ABC-type sugar transport system ATPase subunit
MLVLHHVPEPERAVGEVARSVKPGGRVLIVDEATAPMSADEAEQLFAVIGRVAATGMAVLYISHRLDEVAHVADRIVVMRDAARVAEFTAASLRKDALVAAMIGDQDLSVGARGRAGGAPRLTVEGLRTPQLGPIDLTVRAGEIVSVYGIAGAGREELGPAIVGAAARSAGRLALDGAEVAAGRIRSAIEAGIGYVPAERRTEGLVLDRSIVDNVALSVLDRESRGGLLRRRRVRALAQEYVARLDIATSSVDAPVRSLSGGGQQKVLLARCLAARSRALVLDEPTRGVDVAAKAEIYRTLRELAGEGVAVLVISSDLEEVVTIGDRVVVLAGGDVVAELEGGAISQEAVTAAALSRVLEAA